MENKKLESQDNNLNQQVELSTRKLQTFTRKLNAGNIPKAEDLFKNTVQTQTKSTDEAVKTAEE